jgi:exopolysaccharide production protein ExoQ
MISTRGRAANSFNLSIDWPWLFAFIAFTLLIASVVLKTAGVGVFLIVTFAYTFHVRRNLVSALIPALPFVVLPALAVFSTLWSDSPASTLRSGVQYFLTFYFAVLVARAVPSSKVLTALFYALLLICLLSMVDLHTAISRHRALSGIFESKNSMAFTASALMLVAFGLLIDPVRSLKLRVICLGCIPFAFVQLVLSQSAGAVVSTTLSAIIMLAVALLGRCPPSLRLAAFLLVVACIPGVLVATPILQKAWTNFATETLHKDIVTMTGRTTMWTRGDELARNKPLLGHGYQAFWIQGNLDAEALWEELEIPNRSGFNFHNQFKELRVDLGWAGVIAFYGILATGLIGLLVRPFISPSHTLNVMLGLLVSLALKTPVESLLFYQFSILSVLFITLCTVGLAGEVGRPRTLTTKARSAPGFRRSEALRRRQAERRPSGARARAPQTVMD